MREIPLTQGYVALVDDADFPGLSRFSWSVSIGAGGPYARRRTLRSEAYGTAHISMHRMLAGPGEVDHRNGNGLDNQRANLRPATHAQNGANQRVPVNSTSGFKGVSKRRDSRMWAARIRVGGQLQHLGMHKTAEAAARAYDDAAREAYGEFAALNFPKPGEQSAHRVEIGA